VCSFELVLRKKGQHTCARNRWRERERETNYMLFKKMLKITKMNHNHFSLPFFLSESVSHFLTWYISFHLSLTVSLPLSFYKTSMSAKKMKRGEPGELATGGYRGS